MILLLFLQIQKVVMEITKCEIVHGHPDILYPSNSNQFVESLDNYFHGEGLTYILNNTVTQFGVSQSISVTNKSQSAFPGILHNHLENTIFIDDAAQYNWTNPNYQTGQFAALVEYDSTYYVYEASFSTKAQSWSQVTMGFSNTATVLCTNVKYIFENDFLVSCLSRPDGFQLFYYFQRVQYKIFTKYIPGILIRVDTTIFLLNNAEFSYLQVLNDKSKSIYVTVAHANYYNENTVVQVFSVEVQRSVKEPLKFYHHYVRQHDRAIYGAYLASAYESKNVSIQVYLLFYDVLVLHHTRDPPNFKDGFSVTEAQGMGVFKETYTDENYNVFISIVTKDGLVFYSTSHLQSNQQPALPKDFDTNKRLRVKVSAAYSVVSDGTTVVVYANRYDYKESLNQYGFLYSKKFTIKNIIFIFDTLGSNFNVYDNSYIYTYQIQIPYIYSLATLNKNYGVEQTLTLYAMAENGKNCSVELTYELINPNTTLSFVAQSNKREREEPYLLFNSQSKLIKIGEELIGANLQYASEITQILPTETETDIIEPQQPTATFLQTNLIELSEPFVVSFSYSYQVDDETYLLFTQLTNSLNFLKIQRCKFIACMETIQIQHELQNQQIISIAAFKADLILHVVIGSESEIISIDFLYSNLNKREPMNHISLKEKTGVPTIQLSSLQFLNEALLVLTNTPNAIICYNTLLREQYTLTGNELSPRAIFINNFIYNDTYFVDNQYELIAIQHTKNLELKEFTEVKYNYNILASFNYPNNYKQQQIQVGLIKSGFYLIQITAQRTNVYFYPYSFLYYYIVDSSKFSFSVQVIPITSMGVTIAQPFVTGVSGQDYFYVSVVQNTTGQQQVVVLRPSAYEFDQLYQIIDIQLSPTSFNLITINRIVSKWRNDDLNFQYDVLIIQSSNTNALTIMQVFKEAMMLFTPNIQFNNLDTFGVNITATASTQEKVISRFFKVTKQVLGIIQRSSQVNTQQVIGSIFYISVNPADFFYGYVSNYTAIDKIGLRLDLQDVYVDCILQDKQHQIINNSVVLPIILEDAKYNLNFTTATSGIIAGTDYVQTFLLSGRAIYILFEMEAFYLYSVPATLTSQCLFAFITPDTGYLVTVCSDEDDTFFYYYKGTQANNRTMMAFSSYSLINVTLPGLKSAQFQDNVLSLTYKTFVMMMSITVTNVTMGVNYYKQFKYSYDILSTSLFVVDLYQLGSSDTREKANTFVPNMGGAGVIFLYTNGVLQFQYYDQKNNSISKYATYQTHLPNGIQVKSVSAFSYGLITNTYISVPFVIATNSVSYLFQVTLPISGGSAQTYLIYTLIPYDRYKTVAVYVSGSAIAAIFYTDLDIDEGHREYVVGLYGVPTLKNYENDEQLKIQFDPDRVYQHAGTSIGFVGLQNLTNQTISNFVFTSNQTLIYQVNKTAFSYMYLNTKIRLTINQVQCINSSTIHHALFLTKIELVATNNLTKDFSRNSFIVENVYPSYTFLPLDIRRNFWWQFGVGVIMFGIIAGVISYLFCNSNKLIVYQEQNIELD